MTTSITLPRILYPEIDQQIRTYDLIMEKLAAIPEWKRGGVNPTSRAITNAPCLSCRAAPRRAARQITRVGLPLVKPDYFKR